MVLGRANPASALAECHGVWWLLAIAFSAWRIPDANEPCWRLSEFLCGYRKLVKKQGVGMFS